MHILMQQGNNDRIYFGGLNGLRFFAATAVIFHHIEQYKLWSNNAGTHYTSYFGKDTLLSVFFEALGSKAVSLFFVLSGFLITYLLLAEVEKKGTIALKKFYYRRILRIWPVYYLVILVAFFIMPRFFDIGGLGQHLTQNHFWIWCSLCLFMLPNLVRYNSVELIGGNQTWSVGVEEQFYLIWPWLVSKFKGQLVKMLLVLIVLKMLVSIIASLICTMLPSGIYLTLVNKFLLYWNLFKIEQMAIGALGAWCLFVNQEKIVNFIFHKITIWISVVLFTGMMCLPYKFTGDTLIEAFVFLVFIMNVSRNPLFPLKFQHPYFNVLGSISYGIYMYHTIVIAILITVLQKTGLDHQTVPFNLLLYTGSIGLTILLAYFSYNYFEKPFLKLKDKYTVVKSSGQEYSSTEEVRSHSGIKGEVLN